MRHDDIEELKTLIDHTLELDTFFDLLDVSFPEILDKFEDEIEENYDKLHAACR